MRGHNFDPATRKCKRCGSPEMPPQVDDFCIIAEDYPDGKLPTPNDKPLREPPESVNEHWQDIEKRTMWIPAGTYTIQQFRDIVKQLEQQ